MSKPLLAAEVEQPGVLATSPDGKFLYAIGKQGGKDIVSAYRISGPELSLLNRQEVGDRGSAHIVVHPSGRFLMTAQYGGGSVAVFPIRDDGGIGPRSQRVRHEGGSGVVPGRQDAPHPHMVGFSPDGGFVHLLEELSLTVTTFRHDTASATLAKNGTTATLPDEVKAREKFNSASEILVHPNGRFLYTGNRGHDSVTVLEVDPRSGQTQVVEVEPIRGSWPRNINLSPSGNWRIAAGAHSHTLSVFSVDDGTGELTFLPQSPVHVPSPICIVFLP